MKLIKDKNINNRGRYLSLITLMLIIFSMFSIKTQAQEYLRLYSGAPGEMVSNVTGGTLTTETFESFNGLPNYAWATMPTGYNSSIGQYYQTSGNSYVKNDDQYGAGTDQYLSLKVGAKVNLVFDNPVTYFGFAWPAGDGSNTIKIKRNGAVIGVFATSDIIALLPNNASNYIATVNGGSYSTNLYYGKPGTGQNSNEPYSYLHFVSSLGLAFDEVELTMGNGGQFENDNHSLISTNNPIIQGDWVKLVSILAPTTQNDTGSGIVGNSVTVDVLNNDSPGDAPIDITSVQIIGSNGIGASLTVANEGVWSVNSLNGKITFAPEIGFTGNPTPIEYSVLDTDGFASNVSTVTITYIGGPTAINDSKITELNTSVDINILQNDIAGSTAIDPTTVTFIGGTEPNPTTEGLFTVNSLTGLVTFTPANGFLGNVTISYQVCDLNSLCSIAIIDVSVLTGATNLFPALGPGTLGFEDLWPAKGDYDFNDLVIDYQFEINSNINNYVDNVVATFTIKAFGAAFRNGFGFQLSSAINAADLDVSGYDLKENFINLNSNGTEVGQENATIIVYDNSFKQMLHPGTGIGVNTDPIAPYVTPVTLVINIEFTPNTYNLNDLDIANFNPFIFVDKDRSVEVHLPDYAPTSLANQSLFGVDDDDSDASQDRYYKTVDNLPWAINIYESFDYPIEKQDIVLAHLKFAPWANSSGALFQDWYKDLQGYRNDSKIYEIP